MLAAIWGVELNFGAEMGGRPLVQSLATLACFGERPGYFRSELMAALKIIDRGDIPADKLAGSWAGAFGQTQFMPSSYLRLAAPGADGGRDIVEFGRRRARLDRPLLRQVGLALRRPMGLRGQAAARLQRTLRPQGESADVVLGGPRDRTDRRALARRRRSGSSSPRRRRRPRVSGDAQLRRRLFLQRRGILFAGRLHPADRLAGGQGIVTPWPTDDPGLSRVERRELQTLLARRGYDVGQPDGAIGNKTKEAIADFQGKVGLPVNGRASQKVLQALRQ